MKWIRNILDNMKPSFEKGGKLHAFHSSFDAVETLFFVPNKVTTSGAHIRDAVDMKRTMMTVVIALMPALFFGMYNVGLQHALAVGMDATILENFWFGFLRVLPIIVVSYAAGLITEIIFAQIKGHEVPEGFFVSGMLIPLIVPVDTPLWMIGVATVFAVVIGKEAFGGSGMNIVNPALLTRVFLFLAYPQFMTGEKVWVHIPEGEKVVDGFTGATPLGDVLTGHVAQMQQHYSLTDMIFGFMPGSIGETSVVAILLGAVILLWTGIASWKILVSVVTGGLLMGFIFNIFGGTVQSQIPAWEMLLLGGFAFGAVFMATDPVTAAQTNRGKYIYGFLIGLFAILFRVVNPGYPEGMMFAILFMNVFAPLIDHYVVGANIKRRLKRVKAV